VAHAAAKNYKSETADDPWLFEVEVRTFLSYLCSGILTEFLLLRMATHHPHKACIVHEDLMASPVAFRLSLSQPK
jgi:hypothetical protein